MEIIERIYQLLEEKDKRANALCEKLNIRTSTISTWKARTNDPPARYMETTADFFGVSPEYLMTGHEAPVRKTTTREEDELPELFRCLPVENSSGILAVWKTKQNNMRGRKNIWMKRKNYQFRMVQALYPAIKDRRISE